MAETASHAVIDDKRLKTLERLATKEKRSYDAWLKYWAKKGVDVTEFDRVAGVDYLAVLTPDTVLALIAAARRAQQLEAALRQYADEKHWIQVADDGITPSILAGWTGDGDDGWDVARAALATGDGAARAGASNRNTPELHNIVLEGGE